MRPKFTQSYIDVAANFLVRTKGVNQKEAKSFIKSLANNRFVDRRIKTQHYPSPGHMTIETGSLLQLVEEHRDDVISPSGSIYRGEHKTQSVISQMVAHQMKERKTAKKKMMEAKKIGDDTTADIWNLRQASIKIAMNSLMGGFGSAYNVFYDKGGYNAITSFGRTVIITAYTIAEELFGGVFGLYDEQMAINHLINILNDTPTKIEVDEIINEFGFKIPTSDELYVFFKKTVDMYRAEHDELSILKEVIDKLEEHEITYAYYFCNFKHLLQNNESLSRNWIDACLDIENVEIDPSIDKKTLDDNVVCMVAPMVHERIDEKHPWELLEEDSIMSQWFASLVKRTERRLANWDKVFNTFIYRNISVPNRNRNKHELRSSVIVSDTDSVIYTTENWVAWYTNKMEVSQPGQGISLFLTYWLSKVHEHYLAIYSTQAGAIAEKRNMMKMKNEFLYPSLLLFDTKKMYAGIVSIQEGVVLPKPVTDIKGVQLKGSNFCQETTEFVEKFITDDVLSPSTKGNVDPKVLIQQVLDFEKRIRDSLVIGETTYLKVDSLSMERDYKDPIKTSQWVAYLAWERIFAHKYGDIHPPGKYPSVPILPMVPSRERDMVKNHPDIMTRWDKFKNEIKSPNFILVNPLNDRIPEELLPCIDIRSIVYYNVKPLMIILEQLCLGIGFEQNKMLYSDVFGFTI